MHIDMNSPASPPSGSAASSTPATDRAALGALLAALAAWAAGFIYRTSFVLDGRRVFCLFDDAMISMTYARNLVEGHGLNWARRGAPVEGFTHPLWAALMVPVNLLPLNLDRRPLLVQVGSLVFLLLNVVLVRRLVRRHFTRPGARHWLPACVLTAFYYPLNFWALIGMETGLQALLTTAMVLLAFDIVHGRRDRHLALLLAGTAAVLLRLDMLLLVLAVQVWVWAGGGLRQPRHKQGDRDAALGGQGEAARPGEAAGQGEAGRQSERGEEGELDGQRGPAWSRGADLPGLPNRLGWRLGWLVLVFGVAAYGAFRWAYFHELLPNTYYLKLAGIPLAVRLLRGGSVLLDSLRAHGPLLVGVAIGVLPQLVPAWRRGRRRRMGAGTAAVSAADAAGWPGRLALPAALFALCCAYSVFVGGDAWEDEERANRFVAFAMPMVFVLLNALSNQALSAWAGVRRLRRARRVLQDRAPGGTGRRQPVRPRSRGPLIERLALAAVTAALLVANGLWLQENAEDTWQAFALLSRPLHADKYAEILGQLRTLQKIADPDAAVAVTWAGITAYFSDFKMVDELGYNDRHIAHEPPSLKLDEDSYATFVPGHAKWDMTYVVERQHPDALLQIWGGREAVIVLRRHGYRRIGDLWVDPRSPRLHLERAASGGPPAAPAPAPDPAGPRGLRNRRDPAEPGDPAEPVDPAAPLPPAIPLAQTADPDPQ
jgi:hypothetical protein